ncbi:MAG: hypothetical protein ACRD1B_08905 [Thermoanaerobaculia bacterium]
MRLRSWRLLLLAAVAGGVWWWSSHGKPSVSQMVDDLTRPLFGSPVAVKESERNRVEGQAMTAVADQSETPIETLRVGMSSREVRAQLGEPNLVETLPHKKGAPERVRWTYRSVHRILIFEGGRVTSITIAIR